MRKAPWKQIAVLALLLGGMALRIYFTPQGLLAYLIPTLYWGLVAGLVIWIEGGVESTFHSRNMKILRIALLISAVQIFINIDAGLITKFAKSPAALTPIAITLNLTRVVSNLVGVEVSRSYLVKLGRKKNLNVVIGAVSVFYTFVSTSLTGLFNIGDRLAYVKYLGEVFLPSLAENMTSTYLGLLGGPLCSLGYRVPSSVFQWVSPILPDLPWGFKSLIGVMVPTVGFVAIAATASVSDYVTAGVRNIRNWGELKEDKGSVQSFVFAIIMVLVIWSMTGLLGFQPRVVVSGSMTPSIQIGDIVVSVDTRPERISVGDVVLFMTGKTPIMHRVIEVNGGMGNLHFITKGDANDTPDDPVFPEQVKGKLVMTVPKVGWIPLRLRSAFFSMAKTVTESTWARYTIIGLAPITAATGALGVLNGKKRKKRFRK